MVMDTGVGLQLEQLHATSTSSEPEDSEDQLRQLESRSKRSRDRSTSSHKKRLRATQPERLQRLHHITPPDSIHELIKWPREAIERVLEWKASNRHHHPCLSVQAGGAKYFIDQPPQKIYVTTSYSGIGTVEFACTLLQQAGNAMCDEGTMPAGDRVSFVYYAACDSDPACRVALLNMDHGPAHVFGSLEDREPEQVVAQMKFFQQALLNRAKTLISLGGKRADVIAKLGERLREKCLRLLNKKGATQEGLTAYCYKCEKDCQVWPTLRRGDLHMEAGGNTCVAFSPQGKQTRWLHESAIPCLIWLRGLAARRPTFIIQECSDRFNAEKVFSEIFPWTNKFQTIEAVLGPEDVGVPGTRPRRYSVTIDLRQRQFVLVPSRVHFLKVMGARPVVDGHIFFCAPDEEIVKDATKRLRKQGLELEISLVDEPEMADPDIILSGGWKDRYNNYKKALQDKRDCGHIDPTFFPIVDLSQSIAVRPKFKDWVPPLLRKSLLFSFKAQRNLVPIETFGIQCWPHPALCDPDSEEAVRFPFKAEFLDAYPEHHLLSCMGNSMNLRLVGMWIAFCVMLTTDPGESDVSEGGTRYPRGPVPTDPQV